MAYIAPIHHPSSVRNALRLRLRSSEADCVVVAKSNRLEIFESTEEGLQSIRTESLYGRITLLQKFPDAHSDRDLLFVGLDGIRFVVLSWDGTQNALATEQSFLDVADNTARLSQTGERCWLDPSGRFLTVEVYEGIITTFPLKHNTKGAANEVLEKPLVCRIPEFFVRSSAFIHGRLKTEPPRLAYLFEDYEKNIRLRVRDLKYGAVNSSESEVEFADAEVQTHTMDLGANIIIPLTAHPYGLLVLGETSIAYFNEGMAQPYSQPLQEATAFVAWEQIDDQRFILADDYGKMYLVMLVFDSEGEITEWLIDPLGDTSRANSLVYLDQGRVYLGSHQGDSQLIRISEGSLQVEQTFANIAPILDFTIMDMGNRDVGSASNEFSSGQARVVTGSGAWNDGSLRSVRSGVGLEEVGLLGDIENITDLFNLRINPTSKLDDALLVCFATESRLFQFSPEGEAEESSESSTLVLDEPTLLATNLPSSQILQVTSTSARVIDVEGGMVLEQWSADGQTITAATHNNSHLAVVVNGNHLQILDLASNFAQVAEFTFPKTEQISSITASPHLPDVLLVGSALQASLQVLRISKFEQRRSVAIDQIDTRGVSVRSMMIAKLFAGQAPRVLIGSSDGSVVVMSIDTSSLELKFESITRLGTQEVKFRAIPGQHGESSVFALCENPSLIYAQEGRIVFSAVTAEGDTSITPFNSEAFPDAKAIATPTTLKLAIMDSERRAHVQALQVGETVRRIAYSAALKAFGLGTIKRTLSDGIEYVQSSFKLADEVVFQEIDSYDLKENELVETVIRASLLDSTGSQAERFLVGTSYLDDSLPDNSSGRILMFEITTDRKIKLVAQQALKGACRCLATVGDKIVAALIKTVVVFSVDFKSASNPEFRKRASYRTSTAPIDINVTGSLIAIADLTKSVSVVEYRPAPATGGKDELVEIARHYQTTWGTAVANIDKNKWLEADAEGNLLVLVRDEAGVEEEDRRRLMTQGELCLGEMVNRIHSIEVLKTPGAVVVPKAFVATVEGSLYLFAIITDEWRNALLNLQAYLASEEATPTLGNLSFNDFRAYRSQVRRQDRPDLFVDGELLEKFLDVDVEVQGEWVGKACPERSVQEVVAAVEGLRRLR